jgi:predicted membrane protein
VKDDRSGGRELTGLVIILIGFGLLMNTMGILPFGSIIGRFWLPTVLIGIGIFQLSRTRGEEGRLGGAFFVLFGALFFLGRLNYWDISFGKMIWPAILMWIGVSLLVKRSRPRHGRVRPDRPRPPGATFGMNETTDSNDYIHATAILGGFNRKCSSQQFRGGDFTAIMGGGKVDLRDARMESDEAEIDIFTVMGGMEIQVPTDWVVEQGFVPILGGYDDKTHKAPGRSKRLLLHGTTIMGGISVTN